MNTIVGEELEHIPKGDYEQNLLRSQFNFVRLHGLKLGESRAAAMKACIDYMQQTYPYKKFNYDAGFFGIDTIAA